MRDLTAYMRDLEDMIDVDTVDLIDFDQATGGVRLSITSGFSSESFHRDAAWSVARQMAYLWSDDYWELDAVRDPVWWPTLSLTVDSLTYECPGEVMRDLSERRIDRSGWETAC